MPGSGTEMDPARRSGWALSSAAHLPCACPSAPEPPAPTFCLCRLRIGIVGFGTFGQFLAKRMVQAGHEVSLSRTGAPPRLKASCPARCPRVRAAAPPTPPCQRPWPLPAPRPDPPPPHLNFALLCQVIATSRSPYHDLAAAMGVKYFTDADDFCEEHPEVVILATSILSLESVGGGSPRVGRGEEDVRWGLRCKGRKGGEFVAAHPASRPAGGCATSFRGMPAEVASVLVRAIPRACRLYNLLLMSL